MEGEVQGNLSATDRVDLRKTAKLKGDIRAAKLLVAEGAMFVGHVQVGVDAASMKEDPAAAANRLAGKEPLPLRK